MISREFIECGTADCPIGSPEWCAQVIQNDKEARIILNRARIMLVLCAGLRDFINALYPSAIIEEASDLSKIISTELQIGTH